LYYAKALLGMSTPEFWFMPIGLFLDLWACHKQYMGWEEPLVEHDIDDVIPLGI
jgi:hypothetical protein